MASNFKSAIMTWHHYDNYGTVLQLSALIYELKKLGSDAYVIDYIPDGKVNNFPENNLTDKIVRKLSGHKQRSIVDQVSGKKFNDYRKKHFNYTEKCETQTDLEKLNSDYDLFLCGSDQIWSPFVFDKHYFLDFVTDSNKMMAYAPSIGTEEISDINIKNNIRLLSSKFKYLSVREESGAKILRSFGENPEVVVDPTLLLTSDEWDCFASSKKYHDKYLLNYFLTYNPGYLKESYEIAKKLGLKVINIPVMQQDLKSKDTLKAGVGPDEFISLIKNADYICTDSFHGTVFSIIYNKQFCTFERFRKNDKKNQNTRIYNILGKLNLTSRIYKSDTRIVFQKIEYDNVNRRLSTLRKSSFEFLSDSVNQIRNYKEHKLFQTAHILEKYSLCCGCGACVAKCPVKAISIARSNEGFYRAYVDEDNCIRCGQCNTVCPYQGECLGIDVKDRAFYSYKDNDNNVLLRSSSGGFGYRLSTYLHSKGYAIVGCSYDSNQQMAVHKIVLPDEPEERLDKFTSSKYLQSNFYDALSKVKELECPIAIFGTPCQIAGAKKLLEARKDIVYIDLICHGVPSYLAYKKYLNYLENNKNIQSSDALINFRYKPKGWHEKYVDIKADGKELITSEKKDLYMRVFNRSLCNMQSCYECRWRSASAADIRLGDYWGTLFAKDETGVNMIFGMSEIGNRIIKEASFNGNLVRQPAKDYFLFQQTENMHEPVFWNSMIRDLENSEMTFDKIIVKYVRPFEVQDTGLIGLTRKIYGKFKRN